MRIDLRYLIAAAGFLIAAMAPTYIAVAVGLSLGWTLEEVRGPAVFAGFMVGVVGVSVCGLIVSEMLPRTKPLWWTLWEAGHD